jgi:protease-4
MDRRLANGRRALLALAFLATSTGCVFANLDLNPGDKPYTRTVIKSGETGAVAVIDVAGVIDDTRPARGLLSGPAESPLERVLDQLQLARNDEDVRAVVLKIDSPGGTVTASDVLHRELENFKTETGKPLVACMGDTAASGGYYIACAADHIVAHPTTVTGSIGVIMQTFDLSGLMEKVGVKADPIKSGANKDIGSLFRPTTEAQRKLLQEIIDEFYQTFLARVRKGRPKIEPKTLAAMADGRVFTGLTAQRAGFVDTLGYTDEAVLLAGRLAGLNRPAAIRYHREGERPTGLNTNAPSATAAALPDLLTEVFGQLGPLRPGFYYLWTGHGSH